MSCSNILKNKGLKLTPQRRLILDIFHDSGIHLTSEDIIRIVKTRMPGVDKSTIYRTLNLLEKLGCVCKSEWGDKSIYHHTEDAHHHHMVCKKCGRFLDCDDDLFARMEKDLEGKYGFNVSFKHAVIVGVCPGCNKKANK